MNDLRITSPLGITACLIGSCSIYKCLSTKRETFAEYSGCFAAYKVTGN